MDTSLFAQQPRRKLILSPNINNSSFMLSSTILLTFLMFLIIKITMQRPTEQAFLFHLTIPDALHKTYLHVDSINDKTFQHECISFKIYPLRLIKITVSLLSTMSEFILCVVLSALVMCKNWRGLSLQLCDVCWWCYVSSHIPPYHYPSNNTQISRLILVQVLLGLLRPFLSKSTIHSMTMCNR